MSAIERRLSKIEAASIASAPAPGFFVYEADAELPCAEAEAMIRQAWPNARPGALLILADIRDAPTGEPLVICTCDDGRSHEDWLEIMEKEE
jgi:hypothetical protein